MYAFHFCVTENPLLHRNLPVCTKTKKQKIPDVDQTCSFPFLSYRRETTCSFVFPHLLLFRSTITSTSSGCATHSLISLRGGCLLSIQPCP